MKFPEGIEDVRYFKNKLVVEKRDGMVYERPFEMTFHDVKKVTDQLRYKGRRRRVDLQAELLPLPPIVGTFHAFIARYGRVPNDIELVNRYLRDYFCCTEKGYRVRGREGAVFSRAGLKAHVLRAYPSLVREFGFYLQARDSKLFEEVTYSLKTDYEKGVDLVVVKGGKRYGVALYCGTPRSRAWRAHKEALHHPDMPQIDLVLGGKWKRGFAYYAPGDVLKLYEKVVELEKNYNLERSG